MSYTKRGWRNGQPPYINEDNLEEMDNGIYNNDTHIGDLSELNTTSKSNLVDAINEVNEVNEKIGNLSELETTEKSNIVGAVNELYSINVYSTNETVVGKWVDGELLYRKVISHTFTSYSGSNYVNIDTGLTTTDNICKIEGIAQRSQGYANAFGDFLDAVVMPNHATIRIIDNQGVLDTGTKIYITLEYTKSTD